MLPIAERVLLRLTGVKNIPMVTLRGGTPEVIRKAVASRVSESKRPLRKVNLVLSDCLTDMVAIDLSTIPRKQTNEYIEWKLENEYGISPRKYHLTCQLESKTAYVWMTELQLLGNAYEALAEFELSPYHVTNMSLWGLSKLKFGVKGVAALVQVSDQDWSIAIVRRNRIIAFRSFATEDPIADEQSIREDLMEMCDYYGVCEHSMLGFYDPGTMTKPSELLGLSWLATGLATGLAQ